MNIMTSLRLYFATRAIAHCLAEDYTDVALKPVAYVPEGLSDGVKQQRHFRAEFTAVSRETGEKVEGDIAYVKNREATFFLTNTHVTPTVQ